MAWQKHNLKTLFAYEFSGDFFALLKTFCFIIGLTLRNFRGHIQRNCVFVSVLTETRVDRKRIYRGSPVLGLNAVVGH
jgi:hypothetical protein